MNIPPREQRERWRAQKRERDTAPYPPQSETPKQRKARKREEKRFSGRLTGTVYARPNPSGTTYMTYADAYKRPVQGGAPR